VIELNRCTQRYEAKIDPFDENLRERVIYFAKLVGRYGYRKVTGLLNVDGFDVGDDRVYRIWRSEGLQIPQKQPKRGKL
jgi:hypothetical protein